MQITTRRLLSVSLAPALAGALVLGLPATGSAAPSGTRAGDPATTGLFGQQDPTYDGVYRQSLSLIALQAADARVPASSVRWLLRQQCDNGRFPSYTGLAGPCGIGDGDSTALATIALTRVGKNAAARDAMRWLLDQQTRSGGWEFNAGFGPNANTTGLVVQAMIARGIDPTTVKTRRTGLGFLRSLQLDCTADADDRGALDYQKQSPLAANDYATAQATQALAGSSLPVEPGTSDDTLPALTCPPEGTQPPAAATAAGYLGRVIDASSGSIPSSFGPGIDYGSTANAVQSLVAAGHGSSQTSSAMQTLETDALTYSRDGSDAVLPAASAALALAAFATGGDPRDVGAVNPVRDLLQSRTTAG
jgi:hypothetical protein